MISEAKVQLNEIRRIQSADELYVVDVGCSAVVGNEKADDLVSKASSAIITQEP